MILLSKAIMVTQKRLHMVRISVRKVVKMDLSKIFSNSARGRVMQFLGDCCEHTTKEVAEHLSDIPLPSLYRHINFLIENNLVIVKEERKVRGSRERVLVANTEWYSGLKLSELSYPLLMDLQNRFYQYEKTHLNDKEYDQFDEDKLLMLQILVYLDDDDMDAFMSDIWALRDKYLKISENSKGKKVKLRNINFISAPGEIE